MSKPALFRICRVPFPGLLALSVLAMSRPSAGMAADVSSYALFALGSDNSLMSGSTDDLRRARALRAGKEALLYVREGVASYVIRDPATLQKARAIFQPAQALGARQTAISARQSAIGARQALLGAEQARLDSRRAYATPQQAAELARLESELANRQGVLGHMQSALGEQQAALGREQRRLARIAEARLKALVADALLRGLAQPVH